MLNNVTAHGIQTYQLRLGRASWLRREEGPRHLLQQRRTGNDAHHGDRERERRATSYLYSVPAYNDWWSLTDQVKMKTAMQAEQDSAGLCSATTNLEVILWQSSHIQTLKTLIQINPVMAYI